MTTAADCVQVGEMVSVRVQDQYGETYDIDQRSTLWADALARYEAGEQPIQYPISMITNALEWGWWSCFQQQREWLEGCGVPVPDHKLLFGLADADDQRLRELLMTFGGYVSWLEAQLGIMEGRRHALKQGYEAAVLVAGAGTEKGTEKSKEASAISASETLRQTKRLQIEQETLLATAKGLLEAYQRGWETVSRTITVRMAERELAATGRHK